MGNEFNNIDLVRLSQTALPVAKKYDEDGNGTLDKNEYKNFLSVWSEEHKENPLLMQLHIKTLNDNAKKIAVLCDKDDYKGVLTEAELAEFMTLCKTLKIKAPFKEGTSVEAVLTGNDTEKLSSDKKFTDKGNDFWSKYLVKCALFVNWFKLDNIGYKGSDKFFHAVGNYEAMSAGSEKTVETVCAGQDADKRANSPRPEADYTEDLFANWLGREFAKMYPGKDAQDLFEPLAPAGFSIEKSKKSAAKIFYDNTASKSDRFKKKISQYIDYIKENYIIKRLCSEIKDLIL